MERSPTAASVVVPAHNESAGLRGNLTALLDGVPTGTFDVVVVCNGCTDDTATVARSVPGVRVIETESASKALAVELGNAATSIFPRIHLDADVRLPGPDALRLVRAVAEAGVHAAGPSRDVPVDSSSWPVRAYYRVWENLPNVRSGLFGRGAFCLSEEGQRRVDAQTRLMNDDLMVSEAFAPEERRIVSHTSVVVRPPGTAADLIRRRTRVATGNHQADQHAARHASTSLSDLIKLGLRQPSVGLRVPVFLTITVIARRLARRAVRAGDYTTWLRDESSRA
ncbi:glycosyltransferase [Nocardioides sp. KC13]|uniref:4,4'-diaponeurosporenoate glycosyltransferase n=1 Tax=Nocardioides turkmenicus TaxID=2711220 RepID=A0A6M1R9G2_9ACTN|nr:glycosyltransferase [Nocardioides sp. KC13]NGN93027.1 glycosyltransferase [Nocardioides sp. KC13]